MCTGIVETAKVSGSGKGTQGWFTLEKVSVSYDHPYHAPFEHTLNIDFLNETEVGTSRVAVELTSESAGKLVQAILTCLSRGGEKAGEAAEGSSETRQKLVQQLT